MNLYAADTAAWKALVLRLAGVLGAEFFLENGSIREIHVLADETRSPKQIVRDIQSALSAIPAWRSITASSAWRRSPTARGKPTAA